MVDDSGLKKKLAKVLPAIEAAVKPVMEQYAAQMVAEMKMLVPVLKEPKGGKYPRVMGALRDSIGWKWGPAPKGSMSIVKIAGRTTGGLFITIYAGTRGKSTEAVDTFYAHMQEFGTQNHPANPFFFVVWRANRQRVKAGITRATKKAVQSI